MNQRWIRSGIGAAFLLSAASAVQAVPCASASLADYLALGPGGCSVGSIEFTDFSLPAILGPASPIAPASVTIAPILGPTAVGLSLQSTQAVGAGTFLELRIGFNAAATSGTIGNVQLGLLGATATGDGVTTLLEDLCLGAEFTDPTNLTCASATDTLITLATDGLTIATDTRDLVPGQTNLGVVADIGVDGGLGGAASFTAGNLLFAAAQVPSPPTLALLGLGAFMLSAALRRKHS
jgi:hypothetical protein